jgi:NAD(P)-dependent dehydrogenase (short-subunit alcohol dehydrogenase family)
MPASVSAYGSLIFRNRHAWRNLTPTCPLGRSAPQRFDHRRRFAGVALEQLHIKGTLECLDRVTDADCARLALPLMGEGGSIILTGSSAGSTGAPAFSAYSASKAAVRNLARTWAEDLKGTGIRVNVLSPGPTATELAVQALGEEGMKVFASLNPLKRLADRGRSERWLPFSPRRTAAS